MMETDPAPSPDSVRAEVISEVIQVYDNRLPVDASGLTEAELIILYRPLVSLPPLRQVLDRLSGSLRAAVFLI